MGLSEAFETAVLGVFFVLILAAIIVGIWPQLVFYLGNTEVFATGGVTLGLIGLLTLILVVAVIMKIFKDTRSERRAVSRFLNRGQDEE